MPHSVHTSSEQVLEQLRRNSVSAGDRWPVAHTVVLMPGDSTWNPASTKEESAIWGPGTVTYVRYADGGLVVTVA